MPLLYLSPNASQGSIDVEAEDRGVVYVLYALQDKASAKLRRKLGLGRSASMASALAAMAGVEPAQMKPLTLISSGEYAEEDYLAQFEEDWEREEYGEHAAKVVARNLAAWQPPEALLRAVETAMEVLSDPEVEATLFPDSIEPRESLGILERGVRQAIASHATEVCLELAGEHE